MPLSPSDPYYVAEITPASIAAMERPLCSAFGVGLDAFGAKGNTVHTSGYHRSRQWILNSPDSRYGSSDYSVTQALDKSGDQRWVSAFDFTPGVWGSADNRAKMRQITGRVYAAAKARDPRLSDLREFAGTLDGVNVVTFNCSDGAARSPFDSSHLDHCHGSFWRSRAANDHSGVLEVLLGDDMSVHSDAVIEAWRLGAPTATDGSQVEPVKWRQRDEQWQASVTAALAADKVRDDALAAAVKALAVGSGMDPAALLAEVDRAVTAAVAPLQQQLADAQARTVKLAQALAAAGGALDAADD